MSSASRLLCICAGALALGACRSSPSFYGGCTDVLVYGLNVTVVDSLTNAPPSSATLIAQSGTYVDSVGPQTPFIVGQQGQQQLLVSAAGERPGTYDLTVRSPGYLAWTRAGVQVTANDCHVDPVALTARLQK